MRLSLVPLRGRSIYLSLVAFFNSKTIFSQVIIEMILMLISELSFVKILTELLTVVKTRHDCIRTSLAPVQNWGE